MDKIFIHIIILPMLNYFQLLYDYFSNLNYVTLHYLRLFMVILNYFLVILNYFWLF